MFENLMYAIRTEKRNGKVVDECHLTPSQYKQDFFSNLYYREVNGNRSQHRCEYANHHAFSHKYLKWETYGNGYKCEWLLVPIPHIAGNREKEIVENMTSIKAYESGGHELVDLYAIVGDSHNGYELAKCTYDESTGKFVG